LDARQAPKVSDVRFVANEGLALLSTLLRGGRGRARPRNPQMKWTVGAVNRVRRRRLSGQLRGLAFCNDYRTPRRG